MRALGWFRALGLENPQTRTLADDAQAPLADDVRNALVALFAMRWPGAESELSAVGRVQYCRLCTANSPDFIVDHPDYYAFCTCTLVDGKIPACFRIRPRAMTFDLASGGAASSLGGRERTMRHGLHSGAVVGNETPSPLQPTAATIVGIRYSYMPAMPPVASKTPVPMALFAAGPYSRAPTGSGSKVVVST